MNAKNTFVLSGALMPFAAAHAEVPKAVTDALTGAQTDGVAVASAVLVVIVAIAAFKYIFVLICSQN